MFHDVVDLTHKLFPIVEAMQKHFSAGSGAYYSDAIFFLSVAMHHIMPQSKYSPSQSNHSNHLIGIGNRSVFIKIDLAKTIDWKWFIGKIR